MGVDVDIGRDGNRQGHRHGGMLLLPLVRVLPEVRDSALGLRRSRRQPAAYAE